MDLSILEVDYFKWENASHVILVLSVIIFLRYVLLSKMYKIFIYDRIRVRFPNRITSPDGEWTRKKSEILYSGISSIIFAFIGLGMIVLWQKGYTKLYIALDDYPLWYLPVSLVLAALIQETYYYWLHRWMHHPRVYRYVHQVHHQSISTSVWTSFSFHPLESVLQALIIPMIIILIPMHLFVFLFFLIAMTLSAIINHAGVEIFPSFAQNSWFAKYFIGSTHHDEHHRLFIKNFGLYFTFWDRWMDTESQEFLDKYEEVTQSQQNEV